MKAAQNVRQQRRRQGPNADLVRAQKTNAKCKRRLAIKKNHVSLSSHYREALYFTNKFSLEADIGKVEILCCYCSALYFPRERTAEDIYQFTSCCYKGSIMLLPLLPFSEELKSLFLNEHLLSQTFYKNIHNFNSALVFASVVTTKYGQHTNFRATILFKYKDAQEYRINHSANIKLDSTLLLLLDSMLRQINPYAHAYRMMRDAYQEENDTAI
ncbi:922_t:CDS:2 [Cetraspora pellucida]|uniref:922_t:CDS:1 n=1 Tax=Cetraspora pellucida TaxID=1433469 RepID=A0ACA9KET1_9GLOM|nr:922_t:CDS:2 [Cetraspora pellucida]